jgi:DNA-binding GntR family transcriptional regulator
VAEVPTALRPAYAPDAGLPPRSAASTPRREAAVSQIRRAVVAGELRPGEKLREVALAGALDVSRATLREAMNVLVQDGLLVQEPYRGVSVARLDADELRDLARTRVPLDLIAVRGILDDPSGRRRAVLREVWERFDRDALDPDPLVQHEAHVALHHGIWAASENSMLLRLWPVTEAVTTIALAQDQARRSDPLRAHALHRRLVEVVLAGDLGAAEAELQQHIVDSAEELLALDRDGG